MFEIVDIAPRLGALGSDPSNPLATSAGVIFLEKRERHRAHAREVGRGVRVMNRTSVLAHLDVETPVQTVLDLPVLTRAGHDPPRGGRKTSEKHVQVARNLRLHGTRVLDERDAIEPRPRLSWHWTRARRDRPCLADLDTIGQSSAEDDRIARRTEDRLATQSGAGSGWISK